MIEEPGVADQQDSQDGCEREHEVHRPSIRPRHQCRDTRLAKFYLENLVGNPYETAVAAAHLVMAGVPSRFPRIRFCLAHAGGMFTTLVGRTQRGFDTLRPDVDLDVEPPLQAARRFYADCIAHHPATLRHAKEVLGEDKVLFGSDWPFPMGLDVEPVGGPV